MVSRAIRAESHVLVGWSVLSGGLLSVIDDQNVSHNAGSWLGVPGKDLAFPTGTALDRADIRTVQITNSAGKPVLELAL